MKKILSLFVVVCLMFSVVGVLGLSTSYDLTKTDETCDASISTEHVVSPPNSVRLFAPYGGGASKEGRIEITFNEEFLLASLNSISWMQYVAQGYAAHVDVRIDTLGDGTVNDTLVFEYAKVNPANCDNSGGYPTGSVNTFGDKGIVDDTAYAWLNSGPAGSCGNAIFDANHSSLADWKTTYPNAIITAMEIEVDGWIPTYAASEAFVDDVMINSGTVSGFEPTQEVKVFVTADLRLIPNPNPIDYGILVPGGESIVPVTLTQQGVSDIDVSVAITGSTLLQGILWDVNGISAYEMYNTKSFVMTGGEVKTFNTKLEVPTTEKAESHTATITYTVMESVVI